MTNTTLLPATFIDLEPFAAEWGAPTADERHHKRQTSTMEEINQFYVPMRKRIKDVFSYLDQFALDEMPEQAQRLLCLSFGFIEASFAIEVFKLPGITDTVYPHGFHIDRELFTPSLAN